MFIIWSIFGLVKRIHEEKTSLGSESIPNVDTDDLGSLDNLATSTTTSSKTSVSFVSSSLTTGFSLMSLSDKSAVDATRLGGRRWYMDDCATGSFCSSCAIPPRVAGGLWSDGVGCDACCYPFGVLCRGCG